MKTFVLILIMSVLCINTFAQTQIRGKITDNNGEAIPGANIYFKDTYFGTTSDSVGDFILKADLEQNSFLIVSFIGYQNFEKEINAGSRLNNLNIVLKESSNNINAVSISAGSFDASDETKAVTMRPLDIVTTASGEGDIYGALNTMPGTQKVGEDGGIFVRGGESYEAKTYMDGMLVNSPYSASMPDVPARGRFSPFLFSGTVFSTGGYSAEYGQALSSALVLKTNALPEKDVRSIMLLSVGLGGSYTKRWDKTSISADVDYTNLAPYFQVANQDIDWGKAPESIGGSILFRQKVGQLGMLKSFLSFSRSSSALKYPNIEYGGKQSIKLNNDNIYFNTVYNDMLSEKWQLMSGISYNFDNEVINVDKDKVQTKQIAYQYRLKLTQNLTNTIDLKYGIETIHMDYEQNYYAAAVEDTFNMPFTDDYLAAFFEPEIKLSSHFAARIGARLEYSNLNQETNLQPRLSLAYKVATNSQVSLAYGIFNQAAQNDYRKFNNDLRAEQATHYILNYQYVKDERTFRIEAYYKNYNQLVKYQQLNLPEKDSYNNLGTGYAKGIDIFWRDRKSFQSIDYYVSYSYIDTKREYRDYSGLAAPMFTSVHNFSAVYKQWINAINTQIGVTYSYNSGRPYFNPNNPEFMADRTKDAHDVSMNLSYLTTFFGKSAIVHLSVSNLFGFDKVYGYRYPVEPDADLNYSAFAVKPASKRFFLVVFMLSL
ncbi:MAG: TonB-dependent receptor [Bacteroidales bacterium]|nr:TonB-dependent receptor [Bacteroidales bacterium]